MTRPWRHIPSGKGVIVLITLAMIFYLTMVLGTLAHLEGLSGLKPFDMRPAGYSYSEAQALLAALGPEGRHFYMTRQLPLDLVYPALFALSISKSLNWLTQSFGRSRGWYRVAAQIAFLAAAADYAENALIFGMLKAGADVPVTLVGMANVATIIKATLTTLAGMALAAALVEFAVRGIAQRETTH